MVLSFQSHVFLQHTSKFNFTYARATSMASTVPIFTKLINGQVSSVYLLQGISSKSGNKCAKGGGGFQYAYFHESQNNFTDFFVDLCTEFLSTWCENIENSSTFPFSPSRKACCHCTDFHETNTSSLTQFGLETCEVRTEIYLLMCQISWKSNWRFSRW
jgi:hypothetical protein